MLCFSFRTAIHGWKQRSQNRMSNQKQGIDALKVEVEREDNIVMNVTKIFKRNLSEVYILGVVDYSI